MLSSQHNAAKSFVKNNYLGQPITKPVVIQQYNKFMGGVDNSDNLLTGYLTLKSLKLYQKLLLHLINMAILNSYILNKKYGIKKNETLILQRIHCKISSHNFTHYSYLHQKENTSSY